MSYPYDTDAEIKALRGDVSRLQKELNKANKELNVFAEAVDFVRMYECDSPVHNFHQWAEEIVESLDNLEIKWE